MEIPSGQHPSLSDASNIVLGACKEFPEADSASVIGTLYPLPDERTIFRHRVVGGAAELGFRITQAHVPTSDETTLGDVMDSVSKHAVS
jgi:hypothetical protein